MIRPLVSVIIPTHNRANFLKEALESVLAQDYRPLEIIVVDDASKDETPWLVTRFPVIFVRKASQQGVSAARNAGLKRARGELIAFLDSDDLWRPQKISRQVAFFEAHPETVALQTEEIWIRRGKRVNPKKKHLKPSGFFFPQALKLCLISPSGIMLRKTIFEEIGPFDENFPVCEDYEFWLRLLTRYPVYLLPEPLVIKRGGHEDQLSRRPGLDWYRLLAIKKLNRARFPLTPAMRLLMLKEAEEKAQIFAGGALKRGKISLVYETKKILAELRRHPGLSPYQALPASPSPPIGFK